MSKTQFNNLKCGDLVVDDRGIAYVIIQRHCSGESMWFTGVTLDSNSYNSRELHKSSCAFWELV